MLDAGADLGVVVAFGQLIKPHVLDAVPMVNLHFSLLPRWRGAAPVERAILAGDDRDRRVPDGARGGPRHRPVFACERGRASATERRPTSCAPSSSTSAPRCWSTRSRAGSARPSPRWASRPTRPRSTRPSSSSTGRVAAVELAPPRARRRRVDDVPRRPAARGARRDGRRRQCAGAPGELADAVVGTGEGSYVLDAVQPRGQGAPSMRRRVAQRRAPAARRARSVHVTDPRRRSRSRRCVRIERDGAYANLALPAALSSAATSTDRDRAFVTELVYGTTAHAAGVRLARRPLRREAASTCRCARPCASAPTSSRSSARRRMPPSTRPSALRRRSSRGFVNAVLRRVADGAGRLARTTPPG